MINSKISYVLTHVHYGLTFADERKDLRSFFDSDFFNHNFLTLEDCYFLFYFGYSDMLYLDTYIPFIDNLIQRYDDMERVLQEIEDDVYIIYDKKKIIRI